MLVIITLTWILQHRDGKEKEKVQAGGSVTAHTEESSELIKGFMSYF